MSVDIENKDRSMRPTAIYAGSFNPFTVGHQSVLERAMPLFGKVYVVLGVNASKDSDAEISTHVEQTRQAVAHLENVEVMEWDGLTVDLAKRLGATYLLRGARNATDFEYEYNLATINRQLAGLETVIIPTLPEHQHISSSLVRELSRYGADAAPYLPK